MNHALTRRPPPRNNPNVTLVWHLLPVRPHSMCQGNPWRYHATSILSSHPHLLWQCLAYPHPHCHSLWQCGAWNLQQEWVHLSCLPVPCVNRNKRLSDYRARCGNDAATFETRRALCPSIHCLLAVSARPFPCVKRSSTALRLS